MKKCLSKINVVLLLIMVAMGSIVFVACKNDSGNSPKSYTVNFYNGNNELIKTMKVKKGENAIEPTDAEKYIPGYTFCLWDTEFTNVQSDLNVYGDYISDMITDTDGDGIIDYIEIELLDLNYLTQDSDDDGVLDGDEDSDNDGLTNIEEIDTYFTRPHDDDTDDDGLKDGTEIINRLDPNVADTDNDGLTDGDEIDVYLTWPHRADSDGDGVSDGDEVANGTDPVDDTSF